LQPQITQHLKLLVEPILSLQVLVGNGNALRVEGLVKTITISIQGHKLTLSIYLLLVGGVGQVIEGFIASNLGSTYFRLSTLQLKFYSRRAFITLHGEKTTLPTPTQYDHIRRFLHIPSEKDKSSIALPQDYYNCSRCLLRYWKMCYQIHFVTSSFVRIYSW